MKILLSLQLVQVIRDGLFKNPYIWSIIHTYDKHYILICCKPWQLITLAWISIWGAVAWRHYFFIKQVHSLSKGLATVYLFPPFFLVLSPTTLTTQHENRGKSLPVMPVNSPTQRRSSLDTSRSILAGGYFSSLFLGSWRDLVPRDSPRGSQA